MDFELKYSGKLPKEEVINNIPTVHLQEKERYGNPKDNKWTNKLIFGDNLTVLKSLCKDSDVKGNVRLVYIDPPFGTKRTFDENDDLARCNKKVYEDQLTGPSYVEFLRRRLILLRELLADDWSVYVHIDQRMVHYVRVIMDEVFDDRNFTNMITRKKCHPKGYTKNSYGNIHDFILFYSDGRNPAWNRPLGQMTKELIESSEYRYVEEKTGRIYKKVPIHAPGVRNGNTGKPWRGRMPPKGKHWQYSPEALEKFERQGRIYWSPTGNPRLKVYLDEREGALVQDIWLDFLDPMNQFTSVTGYPTEKNQAMLELIIKTSSSKDDIVIDCFCGSGTTMAAAEKLGRRWIGIDNSDTAIETSRKRLLGFYQKEKELSSPRPFITYHAVQRLQA
jgi:adenine-specific DNA-methyltransferase